MTDSAAAVAGTAPAGTGPARAPRVLLSLILDLGGAIMRSILAASAMKNGAVG